MTGKTVSHYQVDDRIGAGAMGEVYRATDTRLDREVAIKVLPRDFSSDRERLQRFEREARTLAALHHPNIMVVFDVGQHDGQPYFVCELLEGNSLREELANGALPARKATQFALQIARGLAAAHGKNVIHRDLKPENLFVTRDGTVKILDFGLAKTVEPPGADPDAPTLASPAGDGTEPGRVMGTPNYMAPEQVRGEVPDHRTDLFALGAVCYEMLGGTKPFARDTVVESMAAVLNDEAPDLA
ncbi:MAG: serine/threonine protein kinase, partial [Akkermansiaceae bacterium]|nr:serine/threonine protein kinase [Akkermansiaceae bacterium]